MCRETLCDFQELQGAADDAVPTRLHWREGSVSELSDLHRLFSNAQIYSNA